jgi:hypothetical protein
MKMKMKTFKEFLEESYKLPGKRIKFKTLYHGTSSSSAEDIKKGGFKSGTGSSKNYHMPPESKPYWAPERVFATSSKDSADRYAGSASNKRSSLQKIADRIRGRKKSSPETMKLMVTTGSDIRPALKGDEVTIPTKTANAGVKNAQAFDRLRRGTIKKPKT